MFERLRPPSLFDDSFFIAHLNEVWTLNFQAIPHLCLEVVEKLLYVDLNLMISYCYVFSLVWQRVKINTFCHVFVISDHEPKK